MEFLTYLGDKDFIFEDGNLVKILEGFKAHFSNEYFNSSKVKGSFALNLIFAFIGASSSFKTSKKLVIDERN